MDATMSDAEERIPQLVYLENVCDRIRLTSTKIVELKQQEKPSTGEKVQIVFFFRRVLVASIRYILTPGPRRVEQTSLVRDLPFHGAEDGKPPSPALH